MKSWKFHGHACIVNKNGLESDAWISGLSILWFWVNCSACIAYIFQTIIENGPKKKVRVDSEIVTLKHTI